MNACPKNSYHSNNVDESWRRNVSHVTESLCDVWLAPSLKTRDVDPKCEFLSKAILSHGCHTPGYLQRFGKDKVDILDYSQFLAPSFFWLSEERLSKRRVQNLKQLFGDTYCAVRKSLIFKTNSSVRRLVILFLDHIWLKIYHFGKLFRYKRC